MAKDVRDKIIAALSNPDGDMEELERILDKYGISARDEKGDWRSTIEILKDISEYKGDENAEV